MDIKLAAMPGLYSKDWEHYKDKFISTVMFQTAEIPQWDRDSVDYEGCRTKTHRYGNRSSISSSRIKDGRYITWLHSHSGIRWISSTHIFIGKSRMEISCKLSQRDMDWGDFGPSVSHLINKDGWVSVHEKEANSYEDKRFVVRKVLSKTRKLWAVMNRRARCLVQLLDHCSRQAYSISELSNSYGIRHLSEAETETLEELSGNIGFREARTVKDRMRRAFSRGPEILARRVEEQHGV